MATMGDKKIHGRKRQFWVDTNGFLAPVLVHAADISDTEGAESSEAFIYLGLATMFLNRLYPRK